MDLPRFLHILFFAVALGTMVTCTGEFDNPLDMNSSLYQKPGFVIDSISSLASDSTAADAMTIFVKKNRAELVIRCRLDSLSYSSWVKDTVLTVTTGNAGSHCIYFQGRYGEGGEIVDTSIHYEKIALPVITTGPYQYKTDSAQINIQSASCCTLQLDASGTPALSYNWYKNGNFHVSTDSGFLALTDFSRKDTGVYMCIVMNRWGTDTSRLLTLHYIPVQPVSVSDTFFVSEDSVLAIDSVSGVLSNDSDTDSDELAAKLMSSVKNGVVSFADNGSFIYIPQKDFHGIDSFSYVAIDSDNLASNHSSVIINITQVNDSPVIKTYSERESLTEGEAFCLTENIICVSDTDNTPDETVYSIKAYPSHGEIRKNNDPVLSDQTFTQEDINNGRIWYYHNGDENNIDQFTLSVSDNTGGTIPEIVFSLDIIPSNDTPSVLSVSDLYTIRRLSALLMAETITIEDPDNTSDELSVYIVTAPKYGTIQVSDSLLNEGGSFTVSDMQRNRVVYVQDGSDVTADTFSFRVSDKDGAETPVYSYTVLVDQGVPSIKAITCKNAAFITDTVPFLIAASDTNGTIRKIEMDWNNDAGSSETIACEPVDTLNIFYFLSTHTFSKADTGMQMVKVRIQDDDGLFSEWKACSLYIKPGVPVINSITIDPLTTLYVKDSITLHVTASDENNAIKSVGVSWRDDGTFENMVFNTDTYRKGYQFKIPDSTITGIKVKVTDVTDFSKDSLFAVTVLSGRPVIDTITPTEVWIKDSNVFTITSHDPNGTSVDSFAILFDTSNSLWKGSRSNTITNTFTDTARVGITQIKCRVMDKDSLWTEKNFSLNVKLGRPIVKQRTNYPNDSIQWVSGNSGRPDTMFFKWTGGLTTIAVGDTDYNGNVVKYFWTWSRVGLLQNPTDTSIFKMNGLTINDTNKLTVIGKDDDSIPSLPYTFFVFPDGPPPTITTTSDATTGARVIKWSGKDVKDGDNTLYKIVVKTGTASDQDSVTLADESNAEYIISDFKTGTEYDSDATYDFKFTYTPNQGSGIVYHYRIIAKDARGSVTRTAGDSQFSF